MFCDIVGDCGSGHLEDIRGLSAAVFHLIGIINVDASRAADAVSDNYADFVGIFLGNLISGVRESLACRFNAQKRRAVVILVGELLRGKMRLRTDICIAVVRAERRYLLNARNAVYSAVPALRDVIAERAAKPKPCHDNAAVINIAHQKASNHFIQARFSEQFFRIICGSFCENTRQYFLCNFTTVFNNAKFRDSSRR